MEIISKYKKIAQPIEFLMDDVNDSPYKYKAGNYILIFADNGNLDGAKYAIVTNEEDVKSIWHVYSYGAKFNGTDFLSGVKVFKYEDQDNETTCFMKYFPVEASVKVLIGAIEKYYN